MFLGIALSASAFVGGAQADIINVFYAGKITDGFDVSGHFGAANSSLVGDTVYVNYLFDTSLSPVSTSPGAMSYLGGSLYPVKSPALSASITIDTHPVSFSGSDFGVIAETSDAVQSSQNHNASSSDGNSVYSFVTAAANALPNTVLSNFLYTVKSTDNVFGRFDLSDGSYGAFLPSTLAETVISVAPVPIPSGLPMFGGALLGFGLLASVRHVKGKGRQTTAVG